MQMEMHQYMLDAQALLQKELATLRKEMQEMRDTMSHTPRHTTRFGTPRFQD
jgi:hypothetical protein